MIETMIVPESDSDVRHIAPLSIAKRVTAAAIIFLGPPGAGKGTQAKHLAKRCNLFHISTGDVFRTHVAKRTVLGMRAAATIDRGMLVPDELVCEMLSEHICALDPSASLILDGFPRSVAQAQWLDNFLNEGSSKSLKFGHNPAVAVQIDIERKLLLVRLGGRRSCLRCGRAYNLYSHPPLNPGICDHDGTELVTRVDDSERVISERLAIHDKNALPLAEYYRRKGQLLEIDGNGPVDAVRTAVATGLDSMFAFANA